MLASSETVLGWGLAGPGADSRLANTRADGRLANSWLVDTGADAS